MGKEGRVTSRLAVVVGAAASLALLVSVGSVAAPVRTMAPVSAAAATQAITFETPSVADPIHTYGEPDIGIAPNQPTYVSQPSSATRGEVYVSGPTGTGTQRSIWQGSVDGGHTFRQINRTQVQGGVDCTTLLNACGPLAAPGGGDTEIAFDSNRKQYFADLYALLCQHVATRTVSLSGAETVNEAPGGGCPTPGSDRQWMVVRDPLLNPQPPKTNFAQPRIVAPPDPLVYMESNSADVGIVLGCGGTFWMKSSLGLSYTAAQADGDFSTGYCPYGADGYPSIDQETGNVFQAEIGDLSSTDTTPAMKLNIGRPVDAAGNLCFLDAKLASTACRVHATGVGTDTPYNRLITVAHNNMPGHPVPNDGGDVANFTVSSMDSGRNLWVAWVGKAADPSKRQTYVAVTPPGQNCWCEFSAPIAVSKPPSMAGIFPWIQAGGPGRADVVWYGSDKTADPSTNVGQKWDVYMSQVVWPLRVQTADVDPADTTHVTKDQVKVTPHPMKFGDVCLQGTGCALSVPPGNRNLADFFEVRVDNTGAAMIVYDDMGNNLTQLAPAGLEAISHIGSPVVTVARQASGPSLWDGTPVSGPSNAPVSGLADAKGDALNPLFGGTNVPGLDIVDNRISTSGQTMTITTKFAGNVFNATNALDAGCLPSCFTQFVTRWWYGDNIYYAMAENVVGSPMQFFGGGAQVIDDCSVSLCDPHVMVYPELPPNGHTETGDVKCPAAPSATDPCVMTINVNLSDVGNPANGAILQEVGSYSFTNPVLQSALFQLPERIDNGAREVDGVCCYNFGASGIVPAPKAPGGPGGSANNGMPNTAAAAPAFGFLLLALVGAPLALDALHRRRRRRART
jgi:hypothetical protein